MLFRSYRYLVLLGSLLLFKATAAGAMDIDTHSEILMPAPAEDGICTVEEDDGDDMDFVIILTSEETGSGNTFRKLPIVKTAKLFFTFRTASAENEFKKQIRSSVDHHVPLFFIPACALDPSSVYAGLPSRGSPSDLVITPGLFALHRSLRL